MSWNIGVKGGMSLQEKRWQYVAVQHEEVFWNLPLESVLLSGCQPSSIAKCWKAYVQIRFICKTISVNIETYWYEDDEPPNQTLTGGRKQGLTAIVKKGWIIQSSCVEGKRRPTKNATG